MWHKLCFLLMLLKYLDGTWPKIMSVDHTWIFFYKFKMSEKFQDNSCNKVIYTMYRNLLCIAR